MEGSDFLWEAFGVATPRQRSTWRVLRCVSASIQDTVVLAMLDKALLVKLSSLSSCKRIILSVLFTLQLVTELEQV